MGNSLAVYGEVQAMSKYHVKCTNVPTKPGCWELTKVEIFLKCNNVCGETKLGEYTRGYHSFGERTFYPFTQGGKDFALISKDYTCTSVIELPSCKVIASEESSPHGFCPVEFFVPENHKDPEEDPQGLDGQFGFVAGCVWGDDNSWKVQFLDLSAVQGGVILRDKNKLGYLELPPNMTLAEAIDMDDYFIGRTLSVKSKSGEEEEVNVSSEIIRVTHCRTINLGTGARSDDGRKG